MKKTILLAAVLVLVGGGCFSENTTPVTIDVPDNIVVGDEFDISVNIENADKDPLFLHSIDIGNTYLGGVTVYATEPEFSDLSDLIFEDMTSFALKTDIAEETTTKIILKAKATQAGIWIGGMDICFDKGANCVYSHITTNVEEFLSETE
ncbi:hypothetical protein KJ758_03555 [Patescibacteria group bacterium]|nr:hypothetical protein [Patescibacteria group bacterium]